jgi:hypothetical protein
MTDITTLVLAGPDPQTRRKKIPCKQELLVLSLQKFYTNCANIDDIIQTLQGEGTMSLRLIDWFVTNYSKKNNIGYIWTNQEFLVYINYKSQLKAYSKKMFDPFCRRERILFQIGDKPAFLTTVGKLNFFRWAIEKGVLDYIRLNQETVEKEMNICLKEERKLRNTASTTSTSSTGSSSQRKRLVKDSTPAAKQMHKNDMEILLTFD